MEGMALGLFSGPVSEKDAIEKFTEDAMKIAELKEKAERRLKRALELVDMEEQGQLVVLPCKVGDAVYEINPARCKWWEIDNCASHCNGYIKEGCWQGSMEVTADEFRLDMLESIGKTIFLTREEAEKALKGGAE